MVCKLEIHLVLWNEERQDLEQFEDWLRRVAPLYSTVYEIGGGVVEVPEVEDGEKDVAGLS